MSLLSEPFLSVGLPYIQSASQHQVDTGGPLCRKHECGRMGDAAGLTPPWTSRQLS